MKDRRAAGKKNTPSEESFDFCKSRRVSWVKNGYSKLFSGAFLFTRPSRKNSRLSRSGKKLLLLLRQGLAFCLHFYKAETRLQGYTTTPGFLWCCENTVPTQNRNFRIPDIKRITCGKEVACGKF